MAEVGIREAGSYDRCVGVTAYIGPLKSATNARHGEWKILNLLFLRGPRVIKLINKNIKWVVWSSGSTIPR